MKRIISFIELYASSVLRYGMASVILWFSIQQFTNTAGWLAYVPDSATALLHTSATVLVYFNAIFELVFGLMLLFGWNTRTAALLLSLHLFDIAWIVGYGEIGVRDFGLAVATFVIFMNGSDILSIQQKKENY